MLMHIETTSYRNFKKKHLREFCDAEEAERPNTSMITSKLQSNIISMPIQRGQKKKNSKINNS